MTNKNGFIRHRGGKCPVAAGTLVDTKHRDGEIVMTHYATADKKTSEIALETIWKHHKDEYDIMYWRPHVETTEQSQEVAGVPASEWTSIPEPLQWRDRIHSIDAEQKAEVERHCQVMSDYDSERAELVQKLAGEGFALLDKCHALMDGVEDRHGAPVEDMSDWRKWKVGDILRVNGLDCGSDHEFPADELVKIFKITPDDSRCRFQCCYMDCKDWWWLNEEEAEWHSRPTA